MSYFDILSESLQAKLETGSIGEPVALRLYLQLSSDHGLLLSTAAAGVGLAERWFAAPAEVLHMQGSVAAGYVSVLAQARGRTALINAEVIGANRPDAFVRLLLVGNNGSVEFEDSPSKIGREADLTDPSWPSLERIRAQIQYSLPRARGGR